MDRLDRLAEPGLDLLGRVDTLLGAGVPEGHPVWPLLRRMRALPGDAVRTFLDVHPAPLAGAGHGVRQLVRGYDEVCAALADQHAWSGPAATAYGEVRATLQRHLDEGPDSLVGRLESTAGYADALADWVDRTRLSLARTLAEVLGSAEAVTVVVATGERAGQGTRDGRWATGPAGGGSARFDQPAGGAQAGALAAAEIAARVLAVLSAAYDGAETLLRQWAPSLAETPWRPRPAGGSGGPGGSGTTRVRW
ncbi:hypothetical protein [Micromonospora cathayae]|uniref:Uncharacterized protein n=1 Tax=Micromonospora cathayae TaxID=3028804 RepID=A0ABY7ZTP3_9ACTN|nr:hypothetical protein [Micromonospora sp. HUAS 3]WDZ86405.1 hypothetical protein PVK37_08405 [Micromonospora sp. HUAS 3]